MTIGIDDSGRYILDGEILLEENEVEQLGFDFGQEVEPEIPKCMTGQDNILVDNKETRRRCFDLMEKAVQVHLDDRKRGHDFRKIEEVVERKAISINYMEAMINLCAVSAKIRSLGAFVQREESANFREDVNEKIERLKELEKVLLEGINKYTERLSNRPIDKAALRKETRSASSRKEIRTNLRQDFINKGLVNIL